MTDREKVIKGLKAHGYTDCKYCPYWGTGQHGMSECKQLARDALALLKAQEPVEPVYELGITRCGQCNHEIDKYGGDNYCPQCGQAVKWK